MTAVPVLAPLRILPVPGPALEPSPLPGQPLRGVEADGGFVQGTLDFDAHRVAYVSPPDVAHAATLPDPRDVIHPLATALVEVLAGTRPAVQLVRWTSPAVYAALTARSAVAARRRQGRPGGPVRVTVRRIMLTQPQPDIIEAAVVVIDGTRVRAIAVQLRGRAGRWMVEALQVG